MAEPIDFEQAQARLVGPGDTGPLPVYQADGVSLSCWKLTREEVQYVIDTGKVWLRVWGTPHPPVNVSADDPWHAEA